MASSSAAPDAQEAQTPAVAPAQASNTAQANVPQLDVEVEEVDVKGHSSDLASLG
jgi:hypothetical protein